MKTNTLTLITAVAASAALVGSANAAVVTTLTESGLQALDGLSAGNFNQTFTDTDTGLSVTLNFAFSATDGPFNVGGTSSNRLGIDGSVNEGNTGDSAIDGDEILGLTVSVVSTDAGVGSINFGATNIAIVRSNLNSGQVTYEYASSIGTVTVTGTTLNAGDAPDVGDASNSWDLSLGNYTATFREIESDGLETAPRIATDGFEVTVAVLPVPEPGSLALLGLGGVMIASRRRRG